MKRLAVLVLLSSGPAWSQNMTGLEVMSTCRVLKSDAGDARAGYCLGYLAGAWEGIRQGAALSLGSGGAGGSGKVDAFLGVCLPSGTTSQQMIDAFVTYIEVYPERRNDAAQVLLLSALREAYPCR